MSAVQYTPAQLDAHEAHKARRERMGVSASVPPAATQNALRRLALFDELRAAADRIEAKRAEAIGGPISRIILACASYYGQSVSEVVGLRRTAGPAKARHVAMFLAGELTTLSLHEIGRPFGGRDHSSVVHARDKIAEAVQRDQVTKAQVAELMAALDAKL